MSELDPADHCTYPPDHLIHLAPNECPVCTKLQAYAAERVAEVADPILLQAHAIHEEQRALLQRAAEAHREALDLLHQFTMANDYDDCECPGNPRQVARDASGDCDVCRARRLMLGDVLSAIRAHLGEEA